RAGYRLRVADRRWTGSWLSGVTPAAGDKSEYPGQRLGLPRSGHGMVAGVGRRLGALVIDWLMGEIIAFALFHDLYLTFVLFALENYPLTALTGYTAGKRLPGPPGARLAR